MPSSVPLTLAYAPESQRLVYSAFLCYPGVLPQPLPCTLSLCVCVWLFRLPVLLVDLHEFMAVPQLSCALPAPPAPL